MDPPPPRGVLFLLVLVLLALSHQAFSSAIEIEEFQNHELPQTFKPGCYFSAEFQGEFMMQVSSGNSISNMRLNYNTFDDGEPIVQYRGLNITFNEIPVWGYCHKKIDDKVLLRDKRGDYGECIRCFQLIRRSRNIIEVYSQDLSRCYTDENVAIESCNNLNSTAILYRTTEVGGEPIRDEYCPFAGKYRFKYSVNNDYDILENNGANLKDECISFSSELDNCPIGSHLHLEFNKCSFENHAFNFECLGSWPVSNSNTETEGPKFVALLDSRGASNFTGPARQRRPRYRCGIYHVDSMTTKTHLALSSDSSCNQNLFNSTKGYETFVFSKTTTQKKMPPYVIRNSATFPQWAQGEWQETLIVNGTMTFNDLNGYKSYTFITVESNETNGRHIVFSKDQCEQEAYSCLVMKQRSENVMEFTTGAVSSPVYQPFLCNDSSISTDRTNTVWWTLARLERTIESPCPITGQYVGEITDLPGICAELSSNCSTQHVMYYKVYDCKSKELYEERTYLCLGQWTEKGVMYTYTMRNDTGTNECFVGAIINDEEIYIKEAGDYCIGNIDPKTEGMRLYKKGQCLRNSSSPGIIVPTKTSTLIPITTRVTESMRTATEKVPITTTASTTTTKTTTMRPRVFVKTPNIESNDIPPRTKSSTCPLCDSRAISINLAFAMAVIYIVNQIRLRDLRF